MRWFFLWFFPGVLAQTKDASNEKQHNTFRKFSKQNTRVHPATTVGKLATRTLLMEFRKSSLADPNFCKGKGQGLVEACDVDLSQCQCAEVCF